MNIHNLQNKIGSPNFSTKENSKATCLAILIQESVVIQDHIVVTGLVYFLTIALENVCALDSISWFELLAKSETTIPNAAKVSQTFPNSLLFILCALLLPLLYKKH